MYVNRLLEILKNDKKKPFPRLPLNYLLKDCTELQEYVYMVVFLVYLQEGYNTAPHIYLDPNHNHIPPTPLPHRYHIYHAHCPGSNRYHLL